MSFDVNDWVNTEPSSVFLRRGFVSSFFCPRTFLSCFVLKTLSSKAKKNEKCPRTKKLGTKLVLKILARLVILILQWTSKAALVT